MKRLTDESHNGRELLLMLEGKKPLAVFHDLVFADDIDDEIERDFAAHVEEKRFVRHEEQDLWTNSQTMRGRLLLGTRVRLYALPGERWRINAYLLLMKAAKGRPWNDSLETLEGLLLGYTEEQIAAHIRHVHETRGTWGAVPVYLKVSNADLEKLVQFGLRALPPDLDGELVLVSSGCLPTEQLLTSTYPATLQVLVRFGIDANFARELPFEQKGEAQVVRIPRDLVADLNRNLKGTIEVVEPVRG